MFQHEIDDIWDEAYQQGRADKYQEITSEYMLLTEKQVEEIRADGIDEFYNDLLDIAESAYTFDILSEKLEKYKQLKEQKNE